MENVENSMFSTAISQTAPSYPHNRFSQISNFFASPEKPFLVLRKQKALRIFSCFSPKKLGISEKLSVLEGFVSLSLSENL